MNKNVEGVLKTPIFLECSHPNFEEQIVAFCAILPALGQSYGFRSPNEMIPKELSSNGLAFTPGLRVIKAHFVNFSVWGIFDLINDFLNRINIWQLSSQL